MDFSDLTRLASGHVEARIVQVAHGLGIFEALKDGSREASQIASTTGCDARAAELLLNALAALGLLNKTGRLFSLPPVWSDYLVRGSPKYLGGMIEFESSLWQSWGDLERAVRLGRPVRPADMYQSDPKETERFIEAMDSLVRARGDAELVTDRLDLSGVEELLDIGSGPGTYPIYFCRKFPRLRATIFDLPGTMKITERFVREAGLSDRIRLVTGNYRTDPLPGPCQMVFLSNIIHAETGRENGRLMAKVSRSLARSGRVVIKDHILDDTLAHPPVGAVFSLLMLLTTEGGRCYSFREVSQWLEKAGFSRIAEIALSAPLTSSLVIGTKS